MNMSVNILPGVGGVFRWWGGAVGACVLCGESFLCVWLYHGFLGGRETLFRCYRGLASHHIKRTTPVQGALFLW